MNISTHKTQSSSSKLAVASLLASSLFSLSSLRADDQLPISDHGLNEISTFETSNLLASETLPQFLLEQKQKGLVEAEIRMFDQKGNIIEVKKIELGEKQETNKALIWLGIISCLSASAALSGMNIGLMSLNRLELEVLSSNGDKNAEKLLNLRKDGNTVLATILWGNVGVNCLLTLLSDSVLAGAAGFTFSVAGLTLLGEILPQGYFSKNALTMAGKLTPFIQTLKYALYPISKPTGLLLDKLVGQEYCKFFGENELHKILDFHKQHEDNEISAIEAQGASNFLRLDDIYLKDEGEIVSDKSIIKSVDENGEFISPVYKHDVNDPFLQKVREANVPWVVIVDGKNEPRFVLDADGFLIDSAYQQISNRIHNHWHKPIVITNETSTLGETLKLLKVEAKDSNDDVIDDDVILLWNKQHQRIITGADILGRLLRGVI